MKKSLTSILLLLLISVQLKAQKEVLFKIQILPNHTYSSVSKMNMTAEINVENDTTKSKIWNTPTSMEMQNSTQSNMTTGDVSMQNEIPFKMDIQSLFFRMKLNGKDNSVNLPGSKQTIYGAYTDGNKFRIDSVAGKKVDEKLKAAFTKMITEIQSKIKFPDKPMKAGETFSQDIPIELPIAGFTAKLISKTTYILTNIDNGKAYFDVKHIITMDMSSNKLVMDMSGDGDGKLIYDMNANYPMSLVNNMNMIYSTTSALPQTKGRTMTGKIKMTMDHQATVTTAK